MAREDVLGEVSGINVTLGEKLGIPGVAVRMTDTFRLFEADFIDNLPN